MAQLRRDYQEFSDRRAEIITVNPDDNKHLSEYWRRQKLPFIGIADPSHEIAGKFGQQVKLLKMGRLPALAVIDMEGRMHYRHFGSSMSDIPENRDILSLLDELDRESQEKGKR